MVRRVRAKIAGRELLEEDQAKRINHILAPHRAAVGALTAAVVANMPHAAGVVLGLSLYDLMKSRQGLQLLEKHSLRNELFAQLEKVKGEVKNWAIDKVYGSGPRY